MSPDPPLCFGPREDGNCNDSAKWGQAQAAACLYLSAQAEDGCKSVGGRSGSGVTAGDASACGVGSEHPAYDLLCHCPMHDAALECDSPLGTATGETFTNSRKLSIDCGRLNQSSVASSLSSLCPEVLASSG